ncbi:HTH-like domain-containing protein [Aeromonas media]|uniref:HTH-like domain-containing protein n=1 Tax=Aeromonas media TaxID=651 RepID=UPI0038D12FCB
MTEEEIYQQIKSALLAAPRNQYMVEMHLQMLKYADELKHVTAKQFCEKVELKESLGTEFSKMRNLTARLKAAGLDPAKI